MSGLKALFVSSKLGQQTIRILCPITVEVNARLLYSGRYSQPSFEAGQTSRWNNYFSQRQWNPDETASDHPDLYESRVFCCSPGSFVLQAKFSC